MLYLIVGLAVGLAVGYYRGKRDGSHDMYQLCRNADEVRRNFFIELSRK